MSNEYYRQDLTTHIHEKSCIQGATTSLATLRGGSASKPGSLLERTQHSLLASEAGRCLLSLFSNTAKEEAEIERFLKEETDSVTNQDETRNDPALPPIPPTRQQMEADIEKNAAQVISRLNSDHRC